MKKLSIVLATAIMTVAVSACGNSEAGQGSGSSALKAPVVQDGVMVEAEECIEVHFEWEPVEGAEGYQIQEQNKYYAEESYYEPGEPIETTETTYVATAQDSFDFLIKVRAYKGTGDERVYSEWSNEATGASYTEVE